MAVSRTWRKKEPNQKPTEFFKCKQNGVTSPMENKGQSIPEKLQGGPMHEPVMGIPALGGTASPPKHR